MELTEIASAVVRLEPGAFEKFLEEAQGRSSDELSAAALVLSASDDVQVNCLLGNLLYYVGATPALEPLVQRVLDALTRGEFEEWEPALLLPMQDEDVRHGLPQRDRLLSLVPSDSWLFGLLQVVDLETLVVLHPLSGKGFEVTIGGLGDNAQFHTLLGYRLVPAFLEGEPPQQAWVEAASVGPDLEPEGGIQGQFELSDAFGETIWNEGRPADIPLLDGVRVVVLGTPAYVRLWNAGRLYPMMTPMVDVTRELSPDEVASWLAKVKS
ncbi:hypothetical protein [Lentzea sp. NPDC051838]|uniref:hypothetical protein n=1 Tax=Lentzea sp. NPDC051838 TaxID=3154849 RepID=UPI00341A36F0